MKSILDNNLFALFLASIVLVMAGWLAITVESAWAQSNPASPAQTITLSVSPQFPAPGETVRVSAHSNLVPLSGRPITWSVDGQVVGQETGAINIEFVPRNLGQAHTVTFNTVLESGESVHKEVTVSVADVDLIWEPLFSYTPPLYRGKALHMRRGEIRVSAIPHIIGADGVRIDPNNLVYTWKYNDLVYEARSGHSQNLFTVNVPPRRSTVAVTVSTRNGEEVASDRVEVTPTGASMILYRQDPLLGTLFNQALGEGYRLDDREMTVVASPYFYPAESAIDPVVSWRWRIGNSLVDQTGPGNTLTVRRPEGEEGGVASVSAEAEHQNFLISPLSTNLRVSY